MTGSILAHAGGLDEMAIILFPVVVGVGVWILTRTPKAPDKDKKGPRSRPTDPDLKPPTWS
jgi:hypothetical protein